LGNTALVGSHDHADIALLTPAGTPRVLDNPVLGARRGISTIADSEDTMVKLHAAGRIREDTTAVELEALLVGLNGNGDRTNVDGGLQSSLRARSDIDEGRDGSSHGHVGLARVRAGSGIRILVLRGDTVVRDDVLECLIHQTAVATLVALCSRAVNKLLLRERDEVASLDSVSTLDGAGGGERRA